MCLVTLGGLEVITRINAQITGVKQCAADRQTRHILNRRGTFGGELRLANGIGGVGRGVARAAVVILVDPGDLRERGQAAKTGIEAFLDAGAKIACDRLRSAMNLRPAPCRCRRSLYSHRRADNRKSGPPSG